MTSSSHKAAYLAFLIAAAIMVIRGPLRALTTSADLAAPYGSTRAWLQGLNPYDSRTLGTVLRRAGREADSTRLGAFQPPLYPPSTFVAIAPLAWLDWPAARATFLALSLILVAWLFLAICHFAGLAPQSEAGIWLAAAIAALGPYRNALALGQLAIPSVALIVIGAERIRAGAPYAGGIALGLATVLKPQLGAPFVLFYALRGAYKPFLTAAAVAVTITVVAIVWLAANDVEWVRSWGIVAQESMSPGSVNAPAGPLSVDLLELRPLIAALTFTSHAGILGLCLALVGAGWLFLEGRGLHERHDHLLLSALAVLTLLPVYHRYYDAVLLVFPIAWAAATVAADAPLKARGVQVLCLCAVFFVAGAWWLQRLAHESRWASELSRSFAWNVFVLRYQNWTLVALFCALTLAVRKERLRDADLVRSMPAT